MGTESGEDPDHYNPGTWVYLSSELVHNRNSHEESSVLIGGVVQPHGMLSHLLMLHTAQPCFAPGLLKQKFVHRGLRPHDKYNKARTQKMES